MDDGSLYSIGDLARLTGVSVKTIRRYSDRGIVPPTDRTQAGYRRYDVHAAARLALVRTLRELGLGLTVIREVLDRESSLTEVAAMEADALAEQIRVLQVRQAVLTTLTRMAGHEPTPWEIDLMHRVATLSDAQRRQLIDEFLDTALGDGFTDPALVGIRRSLVPELPADPKPDQLEAWIELAELAQDDGFRSLMRTLADHHAAERRRYDSMLPRPDLSQAVRDRVAPAIDAGLDPASPVADAILTDVAVCYATALGLTDDQDSRARLLRWLDAAHDPRRERYLHLLATVNGWAPPESLRPVFAWCLAASRAREQ
ncbi:MerR family transcriptional regulator [Saccharomonospora xinjiangensis]|uniref:Putative transcriptional regulator n=1 Tax=Saccharomonospora xinjiangensis XJ-54 TaxID=882086 RepID=I0UZ63_9PSEU|nr:MerR family transcriptional regulator [Saccharomonospora xinjiangensis]EID53166.1 putative transcriptional regulator [Saccharomonospora xinjiangensis XJ-54]